MSGFPFEGGLCDRISFRRGSLCQDFLSEGDFVPGILFGGGLCVRTSFRRGTLCQGFLSEQWDFLSEEGGGGGALGQIFFFFISFRGGSPFSGRRGIT